MDQIPPGADFSLTPIAPPPYPGYQANLHGKGPLEDVTIAICTVVIALQLIFLGIRVFTKIKSKALLALDDWCALVAAILSFGLCYCVIWNRARGRHGRDFSLALMTDPLRAKVEFAGLMLLGPAVFMGKIALLSLYLKLFGRLSRVRWAIYATSVLALTLLVMTPLDAVKCGRVKGKPWGNPNPECRETFLYGILQGTASLIIDLFILILPIPITMRLNLARRKQFGVLIIFLTGIVAIIADVIIMKFRVDLYKVNDPTWAGFLITLCSIVETGISVVVSSMPTIAQFSRQHLVKSGFYITLCSYLGRSECSRPLAGSASFPNSKPRKRYDPYSINMATDNSVAKLHSNTYIELGEPHHVALAAGKDIRRTISVEQSSVTYSEPSAKNLV